jgi:hypothetical protein
MSESIDHIGVTPAALDSFRAAHDQILTETTRRSAARTGAGDQPRTVSIETIRAGLQFTLRILDAAMATDSVEILDDQLQWAGKRLPHDNVSPALVLAEFQLLAEVIDQCLEPEHAAEISHAVRWLVERQGAMFPGKEPERKG